MATLLLQAAGAALGSVFGPVGAIIGRAAGALAGNAIDRALIGGGTTVRGSRLSTARIPGADEGTAINRVYGAARIGGTMIWATRFEEEVTSERTGGKSSSGPRVETFRYFANFAVGLCEGPVASVRRVWVDGKELDLTKVEMRFYPGDGEQLPDPLIEAKQGAGIAPAYRGLAYVVFERLPLDNYGNRIPLMQFEVVRPIGRLEEQVRAICITPGATEHGYRTVAVSEKTGAGSARLINRNSLQGLTDWVVSIDELMAVCPNLERVALVVSWFGTDLRAGNCRIVPGVEVRSRSNESSPWSVDALSTLAFDVKALLPSTKLTYAADWSEYFGYHPQDGSGDVYFHLDPLWAADAIDAVGIDNYMPLSDWRDDDLAKANPDGMRTPDDPSGLMAGIESGEGFDWYYASEAARKARVRSPISDGLAGKAWVFRYKDIEGWWANGHYERVGGVEKASPTAWLARSKPVWFTELGCGAVDKGGNQPNVFADPKSAESAAPYFSSRMRSDAMQRRFLEAHHDWWSGDQAPGGMVDPQHLFLWSWDARPYPAFPQNAATWSDGPNWRTGHWLNGRLGSGTLADVIATVLRDHAFEDFDVSEVSGAPTGYVQGDLTSARSLIEPLLETFQVDAFEDGGLLRFRSRGKASLPAMAAPVLADPEERPLWQETRGHDSDFAAEAVVTFYNPDLDYEQAGVRSHRTQSATNRVLKSDLPAVVAEETALAAAEGLLRDNRIGRRSIRFALPPHDLRFQAGDVVTLPDGPQGCFLISRIEDGEVREVEAREFSPSVGSAPAEETGGKQNGGLPSSLFAPVVHLMDLPRFESGEAASFARGAVFARPWRTIGLSSSVSEEGYRGRALIERPAKVGTLAGPLSAGARGRFDWSKTVEVNLASGELSSASAVSVLNGGNLIAVLSGNGAWEVLSFQQAEEISAGRWRLEGLLRALAGTDDAMDAGAEDGAAVVVLDGAVVPLSLGSEEIGLRLNWIAEAAGTLGKAGPFPFEGGMRAETPLSPVHVRARRDGAGAAVFSWVRRGRIDADNWMATDIPLDEPFERYRVEMLSGSAVKRQADVTSPTWTYPQADELADFGNLQTALTIRVWQMGQRIPLGLPAMTTVDF